MSLAACQNNDTCAKVSIIQTYKRRYPFSAQEAASRQPV